jgi:23S rRNA (uracil1939-C5)-methyltransferase
MEPAVSPVEEVDVTIEDLGEAGDGRATLDGHPLWVSGTIPGERVRVRIRKRYRTAAVGAVVAWLEPSPDRVVPPCGLVGRCSGCQLQHVAYPRQLDLKGATVRAALRVHGLDDATVAPTVGMDDPWNYRNHARFTVQDGRLGFVEQRQRTFLPLDDCRLLHPSITELLRVLPGHVDTATQCNVRIGTRTGERMIQPALALETLAVATGQAFLHEELEGVRFRIGAASFFQVNTTQAERLVGLLREGLALAGHEVVVDAYAGVGVFAALLAGSCRHVVAIEESGPAVRDARVNLAAYRNVEIHEGRTESVLPTLESALGGPVHRVILDPPRSGCHPRVLDALASLRPERVAYVSCHPTTLARDLARLAEHFTLERVIPLDMFPHTKHVECVAFLRRHAT